MKSKDKCRPASLYIQFYDISITILDTYPKVGIPIS